MKGLRNNKGFLTLMVAQAISNIGDWLSIVAIITLVGLKWNASPIEVSFIILCLAVPMALLGPVAGTIADRFSRKQLMVLSDIVRAGLFVLLALANTLWMVYICLFTIGLFSAVFNPAKNGKLKELVPNEEIKSAMSITAMIDSATKIFGPILSGILVSAAGTTPVFYINSVSFIISAILIFLLPKVAQQSKEGKVKDKAKSSYKTEFMEGVSFIKSNTQILVGMLFLGFSLLILQLSDSQIIVLIRELKHASPGLFGYLVTGSGVGMFFSSLILAKKTNYRAYNLMLIGVCGIGFGFGMMALFTHFNLDFSIVWAPLLGLFAGFAAGLVFVPFQASVQVDTPVELTGRVFGVIGSVTTTATIIGPLLGGWLSTVIGVIPTFIISASLLVSISLVGFLTKNRVERGKNDVSESQQGAPTATSN
ncbi:MFS transporter [Bacillus sp. AFS077874]|uniref:MFS transporter n=1 Tax=unclassified Bacillus (in: firmicutes) TaxID=185979 RepID=UPI000BED10A5|nr:MULTISPECIES: MFS transporter [unclassified Bacillus (in: firmicutes)]PEC47743.1 MFS transporter [Bacillus sp. AFS096315]PFM83005.1 MFS transporter [Bacillus sp. AFS077874]